MIVRTRRKYPCVCHPSKLHIAKGLCASCYNYWKKYQRLVDYTSERLEQCRRIISAHEDRKTQIATIWEKRKKEEKRREETFYLKGRDKSLRDRYGISLKDFASLKEKQNGVCAICKTNSNSSTRTPHLYVDHDHRTKRVRGLLCPRCNTLVGFFETAAHLFQTVGGYLSEQKVQA